MTKLWIAGMADIHKYAIERSRAKLEIVRESGTRFIVKLFCLTNLQLYDQHRLQSEFSDNRLGASVV